MRERTPTPRKMVIVYFSGFALVWSAIAMMVMSTRESQAPSDAATGTGALVLLFVALALHAAAVAITAWKAHGVFFERGTIAVAICALPLLEFMHRLWFLPALLYAIAVAYVWMASRRESIGKLQASPRR